MHSQSACATLTYAPEHLPPHGSLRRSDFAGFIKRLRSRVAYRDGPRFGFDVCGEYSPAPAMRPHYHAPLFGYWPPDAREYAKSQAGNQEFESAELTEAWGKGIVTFQAWSAGAARYCAGHQAWKLTGDAAWERLVVVGDDGRVIAEREPEFHQASTRPGVGRSFFEKYGRQMLELDFTVVSAAKVPVPAYYLRLGDKSEPELTALARQRRTLKAIASAPEEQRFEALDTCARASIARSRRKDGL